MPPATGRKRKEASQREVINAPVSGKRRPRVSAKSATRAMGDWLEQLAKAEIPSANNVSSLCQSIHSSPLLIQAMVQCQNRFIQVIAAQLVAESSAREDAIVLRVGESQVHTALRALGMGDVLTEARRLQQCAAPREKPPKRKKQPQWSGEEIAEQERLLASSKERMLGAL